SSGFLAGGAGLVQVVLVEERGAVGALELRILLVAQPVSAGDAQELEGLDAPGGGHMRAAAEIDEPAIAVDGDRLARPGELLDEVYLHEVAFVLEAGGAFIG